MLKIDDIREVLWDCYINLIDLKEKSKDNTLNKKILDHYIKKISSLRCLTQQDLKRIIDIEKFEKWRKGNE